MKKNRWLYAVLALVLVLSLTACGTSKGQESSGGDNAQQTTADPPPAADSTTESTDAAPQEEVSADALVGIWTEEIAGRGVIEITKYETGTYLVQVNWGSSAAENYVWTMSATATGENEISYENGEHVIITFTSETESSEEVQYTNGTGRLYLNDAGQLVWQDDTGHAADETVFVDADD